nr:hypothetical protein Iba_chr02bCG24280 [Ipomoea batatas]
MKPKFNIKSIPSRHLASSALCAAGVEHGRLLPTHAVPQIQNTKSFKREVPKLGPQSSAWGRRSRKGVGSGSLSLTSIILLGQVWFSVISAGIFAVRLLYYQKTPAKLGDLQMLSGLENSDGSLDLPVKLLVHQRQQPNFWSDESEVGIGPEGNFRMKSSSFKLGNFSAEVAGEVEDLEVWGGRTTSPGNGPVKLLLKASKWRPEKGELKSTGGKGPPGHLSSNSGGGGGGKYRYRREFRRRGPAERFKSGCNPSSVTLDPRRRTPNFSQPRLSTMPMGRISQSETSHTIFERRFHDKAILMNRTFAEEGAENTGEDPLSVTNKIQDPKAQKRQEGEEEGS